MKLDRAWKPLFLHRNVNHCVESGSDRLAVGLELVEVAVVAFALVLVPALVPELVPEPEPVLGPVLVAVAVAVAAEYTDGDDQVMSTDDFYFCVFLTSR